MVNYLAETRQLVDDYLRKNIPEVKLINPEATYLYWLDFRGLGFESQKELADFLYQSAGIYMNSGIRYGEEGKGFMRLNVASPRPIIENALAALKQAVDEHRK